MEFGAQKKEERFKVIQCQHWIREVVHQAGRPPGRQQLTQLPDRMVNHAAHHPIPN